jgi:hypothetical protein
MRNDRLEPARKRSLNNQSAGERTLRKQGYAPNLQEKAVKTC